MILGHAKRLLATLQSEHAALSSHEHAALAGPDLEVLHRIAADKQRQLAELRAALAAARPPGAEARALVEQCRRQNELNGALINLRRRFVESFLTLLHPDTAAAPAYDASGTTRRSSEPTFLGRG